MNHFRFSMCRPTSRILYHASRISYGLLLSCFSLSALLLPAQTPLQLHPANRHYFSFRGKPVLLITSAEHYGALINADFDYMAYLDALQAQGMNNTRVFAGPAVERKNDIGWMQSRNTLAPLPDRFAAPWERSNTPGYAGGGNKFDLDKWDDNYFNRLKDLMTQAGKRGIFIELTLFGNQYKDSLWMNSPLYPGNNIQQEGPSGTNSFLLFQTLKNEQLVKRQEALVVKLVQELNAFDNLYYEICNEPNNEVKDTLAVNDWHNHMVTLLKKTESNLPKKHLIACNESVVDNADVSVANYHYVKVSNMPEWDWLYKLNKVLSMDETVGSMIHSPIPDVRVEAWNHILRGGGAYNNLNWEYTPGLPQGNDSAMLIRLQLQHLQQFMSGFDYVHMKPSEEIVNNPPAGAFIRVLAEKGKQYALYIHHSKQKGSRFIVGYEAGKEPVQDTLSLNLPAGNYTITWIHPATGSQVAPAASFVHKGGKKTFITPVFTADIAIKIIGSTFHL
jgi:Cellulase (glycosyl hydrolase family 5)